MTAGDGPRDAAPGGSTPGATEKPQPSPVGTDAGAGFVLRLPTFEGPLDLLLHLIERRELDITELSVLTVTEQYLAHLRSGDQIGLSALAEFVAMGARLLVLKSRALLPGWEPDDGDATEDGNAAGLVAALEEYRRYRRAADHLRGLEEEHRTGYRREAAPPQVQLPAGLDDVTLDALVALFRQALERLPEPEQQAEIEREPVRLADRVASLVARLERDRRVSFRQLVEGVRTRLEVVIDFLAVLELVKAGFLEARQAGAFGEIELARIEGGSAPTQAELDETYGEVGSGDAGPADG